MTAPFVATIRSRPDVIVLGPPNGQVINVRVEIPELWDVVRIVVPPDQSVRAVKEAALTALSPRATPAGYVMKLRGYEVLDERSSLSEIGAMDGSIFLLTNRRRRPVK
jgi:hypothetical protein